MNWLFRPTDIASLVFFRIAFGILAFVDVLSTFSHYHLKKHSFDPDRFQFRYYGFEWISPLPEPWMSIFFIAMLCAAVMITIGMAYRYAATFFFLGFTYTFLLEKAHYLNHGYLFCWLCFVMIFLPVHRAFSWQVWRKPALQRDTVPYWCLFILQFLIGVVYFFGGIAKLNPDWLRAVPLTSWLSHKSYLPVIGPLLDLEGTAWFMAYGGVFLDLFIVPLLIYRRTRWLAFLMAIFFHLSNTLIFNIGIFPFLSLSLTALYFSPSFPRRWIDYLSQRWRFISRYRTRWRDKITGVTKLPMWQEVPKNQTLIKGSLILLMTVHVLLPLRHHLLPGPVAWTEEGHRYSWRMMLRSKRGQGYFTVKNLNTGQETKVNPSDYLSSKQSRKLYTHPDMILQFAHFLRDRYAAEHIPVAVYAHIRVKLNDRPYQVMIDPAVDLAQEEWDYFGPSNWIIHPDSAKEKGRTLQKFE